MPIPEDYPRKDFGDGYYAYIPNSLEGIAVYLIKQPGEEPVAYAWHNGFRWTLRQQEPGLPEPLRMKWLAWLAESDDENPSALLEETRQYLRRVRQGRA